MRKTLSLVLVAVLSFSFLASCESTSADRGEVLNLINKTRQNSGLNTLRGSIQLDIKADAWARHLRDKCALSHSRLSNGAPKEWKKLGENVGYGGNINQVHIAYLNSPGHKANIMDPSYNQAGTAAVWGTCDGHYRVFTVQVFMKS